MLVYHSLSKGTSEAQICSAQLQWLDWLVKDRKRGSSMWGWAALTASRCPALKTFLGMAPRLQGNLGLTSSGYSDVDPLDVGDLQG